MMENWLVIMLAAVICAYTISRVKIFVRLFYRRQAADDFVRLEVYMLRRLLAYNTTIPMVQIVESKGLPWLETQVKNRDKIFKSDAGGEERRYLLKPHQWRHMVHEVNFLFRLYRRFTRNVQHRMLCEKFSWRTRIGSEDAALTAMATGLLWGVKSMAVRILRRRIAFGVRPIISVQPVFNKTLLEMEFECIFTIRVGNVINAVWSLIHFPDKGVKGSG